MGHRVVLDGCGKSRPHRDSIPGPSSLERVAILTDTEAHKQIILALRFLQFKNLRLKVNCCIIYFG